MECLWRPKYHLLSSWPPPTFEYININDVEDRVINGMLNEISYDSFSVYPKPWISCPDDVIVDLAPNKNTYDITALLGQPQSNVQNIQLFPEEHRNSLVFPYGLTILTYVASNEVGTTANCTTNIVVQGKHGRENYQKSL